MRKFVLLVVIQLTMYCSLSFAQTTKVAWFDKPDPTKMSVSDMRSTLKTYTNPLFVSSDFKVSSTVDEDKKLSRTFSKEFKSPNGQFVGLISIKAEVIDNKLSFATVWISGPALKNSTPDTLKDINTALISPVLHLPGKYFDKKYLAEFQKNVLSYIDKGSSQKHDYGTFFSSPMNESGASGYYLVQK